MLGSCKYTVCLSEDGRSEGLVDLSSHALSQLSLFLSQESPTKSFSVLSYSHGNWAIHMASSAVNWWCVCVLCWIALWCRIWLLSRNTEERRCLRHQFHDNVMSIIEKHATQKFCDCTKRCLICWGASRQKGPKHVFLKLGVLFNWNLFGSRERSSSWH